MWLSNLPQRLKALFSHWYVPALSCIVFRGKSFTSKDVSYVFECGEGDPRLRRCYEVAFQERRKTVRSIFESRRQFDELVQVPGSLLDVFRKFEYEDYVHALRDSTGRTLRIHLPRFELSFRCDMIPSNSSNDTRLHSDEHRGYHLAEQCHGSYP
eukprot:GHVU01212417.1.p1 GENE.GHVU01212417.1~~GHVU01212417.1.p1  ORF type:complete len:155 (-),score=1.41 GHVU01212417.1:66-530(-)